MTAPLDANGKPLYEVDEVFVRGKVTRLVVRKKRTYVFVQVATNDGACVLVVDSGQVEKRK